MNRRTSDKLHNCAPAFPFQPQHQPDIGHHTNLTGPNFLTTNQKDE